MRRILRFQRRYMLPYLRWYLAGTVFLFLTNGIAVTIPLYVADGIDALAAGTFHEARRTAWIIAGLGVALIGIRTASRLLFFTPGRLVEAQIKRDLFRAILALQPPVRRRWPTGDLISRVSNDTNLLRLLAGFASLGTVNAATAILLTGIQIGRLSPSLAVLAVPPLLVAFLVVQRFMERLHRVMQRLQCVTGELSAFALSSYQGVATIQAFGAYRAFEERFEAYNRAALRAVLERANLRTFFGPVLALGAALDVFLLLRFGGPTAIAGQLSVGELVAFMALIGYLTGPLRSMSFLLGLVKQAQAALERIDAVLDADPGRTDLPVPVPPPCSPPTIEVQGLTFRYPGASTPALKDICFHLHPGATLGIVGPTGSGKTTLLHLLARIETPPPEAIRVDGRCLRTLDLDRWRERMTLVPQRSYLFSETIADNILLGASSEQLDAILRTVALDVDLAALPAGAATEVGEAGVTLSGGQRQRTALARGLIRPSCLLLLDDVLAAVDPITERQLIDALRRRSPRPTTVVVAHRLSAVQHADQILVFEDGAVVDRGTHAELLGRPGFYRDTWLRQHEGQPDG